MATKKTTTTAPKASKPKKDAARPHQKPATKRLAPVKTAARPRDLDRPEVGTTLTRQFKGNVVAVNVTADGYLYDGRTFSSLSALARHITGYIISGPVFFKCVEPKAATKPEE